MTGYYLVIMGSEKEESNQIMVNRLLELGEVRKLMKNFYIIKIADQNEDERVKVRDRLTGPENIQFMLSLLLRNCLQHGVCLKTTQSI